MTPARLRECLGTLGWGSPELGYVLGTNPRTVRRWMAGKLEMPDVIGPWLEELVKLVEHPPAATQDTGHHPTPE